MGNNVFEEFGHVWATLDKMYTRYITKIFVMGHNNQSYVVRSNA